MAPDGSYYVSSSGTDTVVHYSSTGVFLGVLDTEDAGGDYAPLVEPGTLAFGPDGNLYVGDLGSGNIFQFNVNVARPWQSSGTIDINVDPSSDGSVGGFTFALNGDVIAGNLADGSVAEFQNGSFLNYLIEPYAYEGDYGDAGDPLLEPAALLLEGNGDLLIADLTFNVSNSHAQILQYVPGTTNTSATLNTFINFANYGYVDGTGLYNQPEAMLVDQDGNLLIGLSPDHNYHGSVQAFNLNTGDYISTFVSGIGTPSALAMIQTAPVVATSSGVTDYTAGAAGIAVDRAITIADTNQLPSLSATVTISPGTLQSGDTLNFTNTAQITGSYNSGNGTLTLTGSGTLTQYQAALQSVSFSSSSTSTAERTVSFTVTDSSASSVAETKQIDVSAPAHRHRPVRERNELGYQFRQLPVEQRPGKHQHAQLGLRPADRQLAVQNPSLGQRQRDRGHVQRAARNHQ